MAKGKSKAASKADKSQKPAKASKAANKTADKDALRQAVEELGGDDADLELIAGVDSDDEAAPAGKSGDVDEKALKAELSAFMKGLDFGNLRPQEDDEVEEGEDEDEDDEDDETAAEDDDEDDDEDEDDEDDSEEEDDEDEVSDEDEDDEDSDESSEEEAPKKVEPKQEAKKEVQKAKTETVEAPAKRVDPDATSGRNVPLVADWASLVPDLAMPSKPLGKAPHSKINSLRMRADQLLRDLPKPKRAGSSSDTAFISQILSSGTHQDKLSALVLLIRESPIHAVSELERMRAMAGWRDGAPHAGGGRDERLATVRALADWWTTGGGKENGKLKYFADQPLLAHPDITDRHLVVYAFEDFLKKWFFNLLQILETLSHDTLPYVRSKALDITFHLLQGNAEQEQNLLRLGVNKLGDTDRAVASKASHLILQLLQVHPAMKAVVAREVAAIVLKTTLTGAAGSSSSGTHMRFDDDEPKKKKAEEGVKAPPNHGRYYGLITLNQMTLTQKDREVAGRLVEVYFEVFREILGEEQKKGDEEKAEADELDAEQMQKVTGKVEKWRGRRKGAKPKGGRKQPEEELVDSAEAKLVAAVLTGVNRALPFAKLDDALFDGYMETLFKICHAGTFNTSIQALQLIFQVSQSRPSVVDRFYRTLYESLFDGRLITSSKQAMYLNLLFKAMKADQSLPRVMAFVKRLLQMLNLHQPPFICGALYLLGDLFNATPGLRRMLIEPEDDGEEHFVDADVKGKKPAKDLEKVGESSKANDKQYDGKKREPLYAHADQSCLWELLPFTEHFHPSVALQANQLLIGQTLTGSADISLNTLISFLDKFVYRNPKKTLQPKGASIMQPAAVNDTTGNVIRNRGPRTAPDSNVNTEAFWRKKVEDVPVDQLFFHRFFSTKLAKKEALKKDAKKRKGGDSDEDAMDVSDDEEVSDADEDAAAAAEGSDAEEEEIWKAMQASMPDAGDDMGISDDSSDEDVDYSDSDEEEGDDDVEVAEESDDDAEEDEGEDDGEDDDESDDDDFPDLDEDEDDLIPLDEMPNIELGGSDSEEEEDEDPAAGAKRKRREERKERRKKRREMPAFASAEDYAALIDGEPDENI